MLTATKDSNRFRPWVGPLPSITVDDSPERTDEVRTIRQGQAVSVAPKTFLTWAPRSRAPRTAYSELVDMAL
jgi:hypothetical protein